MKLKNRPLNLVELQVEIKDFLINLYTESDRGTVLVAAEYLNNILYEMVRSKLEEKGKDLANALLQDLKPISSFSARAKILYGFDLIDQRQYETLETIRGIRNYFGHSFRKIDFDAKELEESLKKLKSLNPGAWGKRNSIATENKDFFIDCVTKLSFDLFIKEMELRGKRIAPKIRSERLFREITKASFVGMQSENKPSKNEKGFDE